MKNWILTTLFGMAVMAAVPANATTSDFNFTDVTPTCTPSCSNGQSTLGGNMVFSGFSQSSSIGGTQGGTVTNSVTMTAWEVPISGSGSTGNLQTAYSGYYAGYGVGICNTVEGSGCGSPVHQIDNGSADYEFMQFQFTTAVNITQIVLANFGTNASTVNLSNTLFSSGSAINLGSTTLSTLQSSDNQQNVVCTNAASNGNGCSAAGETWSDPANAANGGTLAPTLTESVGLNGVTTLIIAAEIGQTNDYFKVQSITASLTATPEPATFWLIGSALVGLGMIARKRKIS